MRSTPHRSSELMENSGADQQWTFTLLLLGCLVLGFSVYASIGGIQVGWTLGYALPLLAAWAARRLGFAVMLPLLLLSVLPSLSIKLGEFSLIFAYAKSSCLLALVVAVAVAGCSPDLSDHSSALPSNEPAALPWRKAWRRLAILALVLWVAVAGIRLGYFKPIFSGSTPIVMQVDIDLAAVISIALLLFALDWRRLASRAHVPPLALIVAATLLALELLLSFRIADVSRLGSSVRLGSANATGLVPIICFAITALGLAGWIRMLAVVIGCAFVWLALQDHIAAAGTALFGSAFRSASPTAAFIYSTCALWLGTELRGYLKTSSPDQTGRTVRQIGLAVCAALILVVDPITEGGYEVSSPTIWILAGLIFFAACQWGAHHAAVGLVVIELGFLATWVAFAPEGLGDHKGVSGLFIAGMAVAPYAIVGELFARSRRLWAFAPNGRPEIPGRSVEITEVSDAAQRIDNAATFRAFGAVLAPLLVVWNLSQIIAVFQYMTSEEAEFGQDIATAIGILLLAVAGALAPLLFVILDWMDRQVSFRVLSLATGAILAGLLASAGGLLIGDIVPFVLRESSALDSGGVKSMVLSTIAVAVTTFCLWVLSAARPFMLAGIGILSVASIFGLSWLTYLLWFGPGEGKAWEMLWSLTATAVVALACIRSVQVRLVLARDHSRELLFGPLRDKSFSVRMAAALGLPSSLWDSAALRSKELWAFLAARPIVYLGGAALIHSKLALGILLVAGGHAVFVAGKRVAARAIWRPAAIDDGRPPILFLRSFDDDQFTFQRPPWQLHLRWLDLWSFRRNVDEAMVDEIAQFGPVVALGRVGEMRAPFGAARHYSSQEDWQLTVKTTALRARAIVLVAGVSPSLEWEIDLLRRENLLGRTVLLFHPDRTRDATNRRAVNWLLGTNAVSSELEPCRGTEWVALLADEHGPRMLCSERLTAAAYVVALRTHFLGMDAVVRCFNDKPSARSAVRPPRYSKTSI